MRKATLIAAIVIFTGSTALHSEKVPRLLIGEEISPLWGWTQFCDDNLHECQVEPVKPERIVFSDRVMRDIQDVNTKINLSLKYITDKYHWGDEDPRYVRFSGGKMQYDKWSYEEESGDCEDFVLVKRRMLLEKGYPRSALLITVVELRGAFELHAVLTVVTDKGDLILDNRTLFIVPWWQTAYIFLSRQSEAHPNVWLELEHPKFK